MNNKDIQICILQWLNSLAPDTPGHMDWEIFLKNINMPEKKIAYEMEMLEKMGLIRSGVVKASDGEYMISLSAMEILPAGRAKVETDGLESDTTPITVKFDEESFRALLLLTIEQMSIAESKKSIWKKMVQELKSAGLKIVLQKIVASSADRIEAILKDAL